MGKSSRISLAKRDDPIFKEGPTFYIRQSDRLPAAELAKIRAEAEALKRRRLRAEAKAKK